jgi:cytochrome c oxidase subunit 3
MPAAIEAEELQVAELPELKFGGPRGGGPHSPDDGSGGGGGGGDEDDHSGYIPDLSILGMRVMLVSVTTLFVALSIAYFARSRSPRFWQPVQIPQLLWLSSFLILVSSATLEAARRRFIKRDIGGYGNWLAATVLLGFTFLASQALSLRGMIDQGVYLRGNPNSAMFFMITGLHAAHLLVGIVMLAVPLVIAKRDPDSMLRRFPVMNARNSVASLYWHCLGGLWLALFVLLQLVGR